jgi:hypothetical protein
LNGGGVLASRYRSALCLEQVPLLLSPRSMASYGEAHMAGQRPGTRAQRLR